MKCGITGHQNIGPTEVINWLKKEFIKILNDAQIEQTYSSLAKGTDQLFAEVCLEKNIEVVAVIPCSNYKNTFDSLNLEDFNALLHRCAEVIYLPYPEPSEEAFLKAGQYIVDCIDILYAVWDGEPAKGLGGTADIVQYAKFKNKKILHLNPKTFQIKYYGK